MIREIPGTDRQLMETLERMVEHMDKITPFEYSMLCDIKRELKRRLGDEWWKKAWS